MDGENDNPAPQDDDLVYEEFVTLESCCEQYIELCRGSSPPTLQEFAARFPDIESEILELLPTVLMLENARGRNLGKRKDGRVSAGPERMPELNDFEIIKEIGRGGMGIVYEAKQVSLDRPVALKVLPKHSLSEKQVEQFQSEAATAAKLHHTNIAPIYGVGVKDGFHYFAMQLLDGRTLDEENLNLTISQVVKIGQQASAALQHAHDQGVFHRDVKPANLILDLDSDVWVTDFGLAVTREGFDSRSGKQVSGTIRYMPPEALEEFGQDSPGYDLRLADIYSLSVTMLELLTEQPLFRSSGDSSLTNTIKIGNHEPLLFRGKSLPQDLKAVLLKAASVEPEKRYQSASEFAEDLTRFSEGRTVRARELSMLGQVGKWARREPRLAFASGLVLLSVISTSLVTTFSYLRVQDSLAAERKQRAKSAHVSTLGAQSIEKIFAKFSRSSIFTEHDVAIVQDVQPLSAESAELMQELAEFYEQLARQNEESALPLQAIKARCQVAELHSRLGDFQVAERSFNDALNSYAKLIENGKISKDGRSTLNLARIRNQLGQVLKLSGQTKAGEDEQQYAIDLLNRFTEEHPTKVTAQLKLELARSMYLKSRRLRPGTGPTSLPPTGLGTGRSRPNATLKLLVPQATTLLESMKKLDDAILDDARLHLLALCHKEQASDRWGSRTESDVAHHQKSIGLLTDLGSRNEDELLYRFELMQSLAEIDIYETVIPTDVLEMAYESLHDAVNIGRDLVEQHPERTDYRSELLHAQFKLGVIAGKKIPNSKPEEQAALEIEKVQSIRRAMLGQNFLAKRYPESKAYRVWIAKFALELAECKSLKENQANRNRLISRAINVLFELPNEYRAQPQVNSILKQAKSMSQELLIDPETESPRKTN